MTENTYLTVVKDVAGWATATPVGTRVRARFPKKAKYTKQYVGDRNAPLTFDGQFVKCQITGDAGSQMMIYTDAPGYTKFHDVDDQTISAAVKTVRVNYEDDVLNLIATGNVFSDQDAHFIDIYGSGSNDGRAMYTSANVAFTKTAQELKTGDSVLHVESTAVFPDKGTLFVNGTTLIEYTSRTHKTFLLTGKYTIPSGSSVEMAGYSDALSVCNARTNVVEINDTKVNVESTAGFPRRGRIQVDMDSHDYNDRTHQSYDRKLRVNVVKKIDPKTIVVDRVTSIAEGMYFRGHNGSKVDEIKGNRLTFDNALHSDIVAGGTFVMMGFTPRLTRNGATTSGRLMHAIHNSGELDRVVMWPDTAQGFPEKGYIAINDYDPDEVEYMKYEKRDGNLLIGITRGLSYKPTGEVIKDASAATEDNYKNHWAHVTSWSTITLVEDAFDNEDGFNVVLDADNRVGGNTNDKVHFVNKLPVGILGGVTTDRITLDDVSNFPDRGTIRLSYEADGQYLTEEMRYTGKENQDLTGITRTVNNSIPCKTFVASVTKTAPVSGSNPIGHVGSVITLTDNEFANYVDGATYTAKYTIGVPSTETFTTML